MVYRKRIYYTDTQKAEKDIQERHASADRNVAECLRNNGEAMRKKTQRMRVGWMRLLGNTL